MNATKDRKVSALLRESAKGQTSRRSLLKQGFGLGLSIPALAGILAVAGSQNASARSGCIDIIAIDYACMSRCKAALSACKSNGGKDCQANYTICSGGCYYHPCSDAPGDFV